MRNDKLLNDPIVNCTFDDVLAANEDEFKHWVKLLRATVVYLWDVEGLPPRVGFTEEETIDQFKKMLNFPVHEFETTDLLTGENNVIRNTSVIGNAVNDWFPTMMKTKITYTTVDKAKSIYDFFADPDLFDRFYTYAHRHFKRDSFYHYSNPISVGEIIKIGIYTHKVKTAKDFIHWFEFYGLHQKSDWDYWLCGIKNDKEYTGYNQELKERQNVTLNENDWFSVYPMLATKPTITSNVDKDKWDSYTIRLFQKGQRLFPKGLKAFRVSFCQYAVNFPPLTARYIYEQYLPNDNSKLYKIFDPSMGWAGRLLGALSIDARRSIMYIGTDPNTDQTISEGKTKYHQVAEFFNEKVRKNTLFGRKQQYEIYQLGSEVIRHDPNFRKHKGQIDLVFTSPPYFAKEVYSQDATQSCNKYTRYEDWREFFLRPTLETCVEWLKSDRYLLWNISDAQFNGIMLPLEKDSRDILESLGMKYIETLKMTLSPMPGGNRFVDTGEYEYEEEQSIFGTKTKKIPIVKGMMKNYCQIESKGKKLFLKYEPILVFYKP